MNISKIKIRKFNSKDVIKAGNVVKRANRQILIKYYPQKAIESICKKNNPKEFLESAKEREYFVAEIDNKILGVIGYQDDQIKRFFVDPKYVGNGIGKKLYLRCITEMQKNRINTIVVSSTTYAVPIYEKLGFKKFKISTKNTDGIDIPVVVMKQDL